MGVSGLWAEIKPVAVRQSFEKTALAVFDEAFEGLQDGHPVEKGTTLGLRVGIDASAWFIHSEKSEGGANPALRNMFHRVIRLARAGVRALFVFDGPHRPSIKRGHRVYRGTHSIQKDFERIVEAFGFEWRTAPGEAEAELAYLNRRGMLDLVITDDVDCLLFGASTLMKHALTNQVTEGIYPQLFERGTIELELDLTVPGLVLVALMSGGDYDTGGLTGIGPKISLALAKAGYGERLQDIMTGSSGQKMHAQLQELRNEIRHEMRTNASGLFERKAGAVANKFHDNWPDVAVANSYYNAITSELQKYQHFDKPHLWRKKIDVPALVGIMDDLFEFVHAEILQKLRSQIWDCMVIQDLIWLIRDNGVPILDSPAGSPSKVLAASLGSFSLSGTTQSDDNAKETVVPHRIEKKRAMPKKADNFVTDELQLLVDPGPAAALAQKHLRHPDPNIGKLEARKESEAAIIKAMHGPDHPGAVPAPPRNSHYDSPSEVQKMWIQESLLRMALPAMVQTWEAREQAKLELKANKGKKVAGKRSPSGKKASETESKAGTPTKAPKPQKKPSKTKAKAIIDTESEPEDFFGPTRQASQDVFNAPTLPKAVVRSSRDDEGRIELKARIPAAKYKRPKDRESTSSLSSSDSDIQLISVSQLPARKSPRKSPRKTQSQKTARSVADPNALQEKDQTVSGLAVLSFDVIKKGNSQALNSLTDKEKLQQRTQKLSVQPKKPYSYQDVSDSDNDSIQEPLPSLTRLLKTKDTNTIERNAESTRSGSIPLSQSSSSSSSHKPSESRNMASKTNSIALKSSRRVTSTKGGAAACHTISQIIDLCSSD